MAEQYNDSIAESRLLAEETVRPIPFFVMLILWPIGLWFLTSMIVSPWEPMPDFVLGWLRNLNRVFDFFGAIFLLVVLLLLLTGLTVAFFLFKGARYHIFTDRIEFQQGKPPRFLRTRFGPMQTLSFDELDSIFWKVEGWGYENTPDTTFIEFRFSSRTLQLHKSFYLSGQVAKACRIIERDVLAPKILRSLEEGETIEILRPDRYPSYTIRIDNEGIQDWDQHRFSWNEINAIRFSKGKDSGYGNFLAQSRIHIENISGETMEFDMPRYNPHAFWAVLMNRCKLSTLQIVNFPKSERGD